MNHFLRDDVVVAAPIFFYYLCEVLCYSLSIALYLRDLEFYSFGPIRDIFFPSETDAQKMISVLESEDVLDTARALNRRDALRADQQA